MVLFLTVFIFSQVVAQETVSHEGDSEKSGQKDPAGNTDIKKMKNCKNLVKNLVTNGHCKVRVKIFLQEIFEMLT